MRGRGIGYRPPELPDSHFTLTYVEREGVCRNEQTSPIYRALALGNKITNENLSYNLQLRINVKLSFVDEPQLDT